MKTRWAVLSVLWVAILIFWRLPVMAALNLGLRDERYGQIDAAPLLIVFLLFWERNRAFTAAASNIGAGISLVLLALCTYFAFLARPSYTIEDIRFPLAVFLAVVAWMGAFICCFGLRSFRATWFPLCCLFLMIPVPPRLMNGLTAVLQHGSAAVSCQMLRLAGVPVFAEGMRMMLPGLQIDIAPECSGIHSFLALGLVALLGGRLCLQFGWSQIGLVVCTIPIAIFKNAVRISVIAWLGAYVDRAVLNGNFHHYGGLVFTPLAVAILVALLMTLKKSETRIAQQSVNKQQV
jgi:exosortase